MIYLGLPWPSTATRSCWSMRDDIGGVRAGAAYIYDLATGLANRPLAPSSLLATAGDGQISRLERLDRSHSLLG